MGNLLRGSTLFQFFFIFVYCFSSCFTVVQIVPYQLLTCTKPHSSLDHYFCSHSHHVAGLLVFRPVLFSERSGILSPYGRGRLALLHRNLCPAFIVFNTRDNSIRSLGLTNILNLKYRILILSIQQCRLGP